jgi:hypothetical protein
MVEYVRQPLVCEPDKGPKTITRHFHGHQNTAIHESNANRDRARERLFEYIPAPYRGDERQNSQQ